MELKRFDRRRMMVSPALELEKSREKPFRGGIG